MITYHITTALDGTVRLSKAGHWGNMPKADDADAEAAARADAKDRPFTIRREAIRR